MLWTLTHKYDAQCARLADRHYSRGTIGSPQFAPPGSNVILVTPEGGAGWVTSAQNYVLHGWPGAWMNSLFRNERQDLYLSSDLIRDAVAASRAILGEPHEFGMITFIDRDRTRSKRDPGYCYIMAGFRPIGRTKKHGYHVLQILPADMPAAADPIGTQRALAI